MHKYCKACARLKQYAYTYIIIRICVRAAVFARRRLAQVRGAEYMWEIT